MVTELEVGLVCMTRQGEALPPLLSWSLIRCLVSDSLVNTIHPLGKPVRTDLLLCDRWQLKHTPAAKKVT